VRDAAALVDHCLVPASEREALGRLRAPDQVDGVVGRSRVHALAGFGDPIELHGLLP